MLMFAFSRMTRSSSALGWIFIALMIGVLGTSGIGVADATAQDPRTVTITPVGNQMEYEQTEFTVELGEEVRLVFENTADSPAMKHNVLILDSNDAAVVQEVAQAAQAAADAEYVPDHEAVWAATPMADPGETVEVTFTAPEEPGTYRYICTFPGHWMTMQGTMTVES